MYMLPLSVFIDIQMSSNFKALAKYMKSSDYESLWEELYQEFITIITGGNNGENEIDNQIVEYGRISIARGLIRVILVRHTEKLFNMLYEFDYPLPILDYNDENVAKVLQLFTSYYKRDFVMYQASLPKEKEQNVEIELDYQYYMDTIVEINGGLKTNLSIETLTVGAYASYVAKFKKFILSQIKQNK